MDVGGIILCGGQSRRMGWAKAWLPFAGEIMLQRIVRLVGEVVQPLVVVAAPDQEVPPVPSEVYLVRDEEQGRGPLEGLSVGLKALQGRAEAAYVTSCDVPFLVPACIGRLISLLGNYDICVPKIEAFHHPLAAVYRLEVLPTVKKLLAENRLRPFFLFEAVPTRIVGPESFLDIDPTLQTFRNLNTPEDYRKAIDELVA